jgi:hypothetical protein
MKKTKKEFERLMNEHFGVDRSRHGWTARWGAISRPYGTYLRASDREKFNIYYEEWLRDGERWFQEH